MANIKNLEIGEFNSCIPVFVQGEHVGATRLAMHITRNTSQGQFALSEMFCGVGEL